MTHLALDPESFVDDAMEGFARVHAEDVVRVDGGIVRRRGIAPGRVAVVIGGGSGHYPAFAGLVGEGLAAGAVCGNVFTSPSAGQAYRVAKAAQAGGGVLFSYGNYAGDVLHFGEAERMLRAEGVDARTVLVTDDIASAPQSEIDRRRGIAGDLVVFRIAGAAAEEGAGLAEVEALARRANARTFTLGVAFDGCVLPGAAERLFSVPEGMMSIGLGIHGEPGIRDVPRQSAQELAATLVDALLAERPTDATDRVVALVNGLGTVKYEELFVLFRHVSDRLEREGLVLVQPECGELVTSLDMAGVSLTLCWLDDDLERLWRAPAYAPAYRKGAITGVRSASHDSATATDAPEATVAPMQADPASLAAAAVARRMIEAVRDALHAAADELGHLDAIAGDGDHGVGMSRGIDAAADFARTHPDAGIDELLRGAGAAWSERAGGTSGALWGAGLAALGEALRSEGDDPSAIAARVPLAVTAARQRIEQIGGAVPGDKTMVDALVPFAETLTAAMHDGEALPAALARAALAARSAAEATAALTPRLGRARPLAARSVGHPDPGAASFAIAMEAISRASEELP